MGYTVLQVCFYQHRAQGWVSKCPKAPQDLPPHASVYQIAVSLSLATDLTISEMLLAELGGRAPGSPTGGATEPSGKMIDVFPSSHATHLSLS